MNPRNTGLLLLITVALGAFVCFYEIQGEEGRRDAELLAKRLFPGVEEPSISSIDLNSSDGTPVRLERRDTGWTVVQPVVFPADAFAADGMASTLAQLTSQSAFEDPQPLEEYGLDDKAREVRFQSGDEEHLLRIGSDTPLDSNAYVAVSGSEAVYMVEGYRANSFEKSLDDLRDKRILDFDRSAITRVEASWQGGAVVLERASAEGEGEGEEVDAGWRLVEPIDSRADSETVEDLLSDLSFLRADGFVDNPPDDAETGLASPEFAVELTLAPEDEEGEERRVSMAIGGLHERSQRVVRGAQPSLYTIAADRLSDFPRKLIAYRFKLLSEFSIPDADRLDLFFQPESGDPVAISATHGDSGWESEPEATAPGKVARVISELSRLRGTDIVTDAPDEKMLTSLALSPPNTILTVFGAIPEGETEAPQLAEIHLGRLQGPDGIVARTGGDPTVYRLDYALAEHIPVSLEAFRNRFLSEEEEERDPGEAAGEPEDFLTGEEESP